MRTIDQIADDLRTLGVEEGDALFVHASLRRVGPVDGGAVGVVTAIEQALGPAGTMVMVLGAQNDWDWVNAHPEPERAALLADAEPFDPAATPALPEVGMLAEVMRRLPGTLVNDHPEGRFAARGRLAPDLLDSLPWNDYYGPDSALARFVEAGGRVLRLGASPDTVTVLHYAEYLADVPDPVRLRRHRRVRSAGGTRIVTIECLDDENGIVPDDRQPDEDYFAVILREFLATGRSRSGRVGDAVAELIGAADVVEFGARWMSANLR